jgi:hypothetical protein
MASYTSQGERSNEMGIIRDLDIQYQNESAKGHHPIALVLSPRCYNQLKQEIEAYLKESRNPRETVWKGFFFRGYPVIKSRNIREWKWCYEPVH